MTWITSSQHKPLCRLSALGKDAGGAVLSVTSRQVGIFKSSLNNFTKKKIEIIEDVAAANRQSEQPN